MFALPSEGSNPIFGEFLGGVGDFFQKVPHKNRAPKIASCLDDLRKKSAFLAKFDPFP